MTYRAVALVLFAACAGEDSSMLGIDGGPGPNDPVIDAAPDAYEPPVCGDGFRTGDEECDDFDTNSGDGCSATCTVEADWTCTTGSSSICKPTCGDGKMIANEKCDDGDAMGGDGCSATCTIEPDCTCSGAPSTCTCTWVQSITTPPEYADAGAITLDVNGNPRIMYGYGVNFTDPVTGYSREHAYMMYGERGASNWSISQLGTWDQTQTSFDKEDIELSNDGGAIRAFYQRIYHPSGTFAVATRNGSSWSYVYDNAYYVRDAVRSNGAWHALVDGSGFADLRYRTGNPGGWTKDESITGFSVNDGLKIAAATNGDVYLAFITRASGNGSFTTKLARRTGVNAWVTTLQNTTYAPAVASTCVYPINVTPLALPNGQMIAIEEAFDKTAKRWLRSHRYEGGTWVVEDIADMSWLSSSCSTGGASYTLHKIVMTVDTQGRPHVIFASKVPTGQTVSQQLEDHYRDATGWHTRTFTVANAHPMDVVFDATGTAHILANVPVTNAFKRLAYIRIAPTVWQSSP